MEKRDPAVSPIAKLSDTRRLEMLETALHPIISYLDDKEIIEIMLNPDGTLWVERLGEPKQEVDPVLNVRDAERAIRLIASAMGVIIDSKATVAGGDATALAVSGSGDACRRLSARRRSRCVNPRAVSLALAEYVQAQIITPTQASLIRDAVLARKTSW